MKKILQFIRMTEAGTFELVTWTKSPSGEKRCQKKNVRPTPAQLVKIASSANQETILSGKKF